MIITCMASCAIHLEVAATLRTGACINALRWFISRRGQVQYLWSKKRIKGISCQFEPGGTNRIPGASRIYLDINPPESSHFGRVWERMIHVMRKVLCSVLRQQTLGDNGLAEAILNNGPKSSFPAKKKTFHFTCSFYIT